MLTSRANIEGGPSVVCKNSEVELAGLERGALDLTTNKVKLDVKMFKNWVVKLRDREAAIYHQKLEWRSTRARSARTVAAEWAAHHIRLVVD